MTSETAAIEKTLWTYLDGLHEGDADKIAQAFHPVSHLYSEANGESPTYRATPGSTWCAAGRRPNRRGCGATIALSRSTSPARCRLSPRSNARCRRASLVDYLTLLKTKDGWRIVAKAFRPRPDSAAKIALTLFPRLHIVFNPGKQI
jgi:hypothetical protein